MNEIATSPIELFNLCNGRKFWISLWLIVVLGSHCCVMYAIKVFLQPSAVSGKGGAERIITW